MKSLLLFLISLVIFVFIFPINIVITFENVNKSLYSNDHCIIKLKSNNHNNTLAGTSKINPDEETIVKIASRLNLNIKRIKKLFQTDKIHFLDLAKKYEIDKYYLVFFETQYLIPDICKKIENESTMGGEVDFAEPDYIGEGAGESSRFTSNLKPNDPYYGRQWGLNNDGKTKTSTGLPGKKDADLDAEKGWDIELGSDNVIVGILDSGVKLDHPELLGRIWINTKEIRNGIDDDENGFIDDINGWNFAYDNNNVRDDAGHGSNIAGTIGAISNNSIGYAGIDQKCRLMICKDLDDENLGEYSWWSAALYYAANNGARIINMSEGGYDYSKTFANAVNFAYDAGCLIVASMMNKNNNDTYYPAGFKNVMAIGATDTDDGRCKQFTWGGGSNWGKNICVVAPGNRIYGLDYQDNDNYDVYWSGTSQATAYVTGVSSLLLAQDTSRTNKTLREIITKTAQDQVGDPREDTPGWDEYYGWGRVDLYKALTYNGSPSDNKEKNRELNEQKDKNTDQNDENIHSAKAEKPSTYDTDNKRARKVDH